MFSPGEDDSFNPNRKTHKTNGYVEKRKWSYKNKSDEENSFKPRKLSNGKTDTKTPKNSRLSNGSDSLSSISHPAVRGIKPAYSHSSPLCDIKVSPSKNRRSLMERHKCNLQDSNDYDDEELHDECENQVPGHENTLDIEKGSKSLEILAHCVDIELSTEQLAAHLASCIELNAANKININNAFNLKLIDYVVVLLKRNDKTMKDFPTISCSLDASTRIYACRVDNVHAGVMEIINGLAGAIEKHRKKKLKDSDGNESEEETNRNKGSKRRKSALASSPKAVSRNNVELATWKTRRTIEPNFTAFYNKAKIIESSQSCLSLLRDAIPLRPEKIISQAPDDYYGIKIKDTLNSLKNSALFDSSFFFKWDQEKEMEVEDQESSEDKMSRDVEIQIADVKNSSSDAEPSICCDIPSDCDMMPCDPDLNDEEEEENHDLFDVGGIKSEKEYRCGPKPDKREKTVDMLSMIKSNMVLATDENDYSYLNSDAAPMMWAGPDHWKPVLKRGKPSVVAECAEKKVKRLKKKTPDGISYDDFNMLDEIYCKKINLVSQSKAVKKWPENKVTYPVRKEYKMETLYRSFLRKTMFSKPFLKPEKDGEEFKVETEYADDMEEVFGESNFKTDGIGMLNALSNFDDQMSVNDNLSDNGDFCDDIESEAANKEDNVEEPQTTDVVLEHDLVPLPRMVECGTINYATVPKRVNMKNLKETVWNLMEIDEDKENQTRNSEKNKIISINFSKIYSVLPNHMSNDSRNDLSPALAFLSVLHLANEKTLQLTSLDKELFSDFSVRKEA